MAATPPPGYTPPPADLPQRGDRATFSDRVDAWVTWFCTVILTQLAAIVANAYANAVEAFSSAGAAAGSASASATSASLAQSAATSTVAAADLLATSTTSLSVAAGVKNFTIQPGKQFKPNMPVRLGVTASPGTYLDGYILTHNSGTGAVSMQVEQTQGSGTYAAWTLMITGRAGSSSLGGGGTTTTVGLAADQVVLPTENRMVRATVASGGALKMDAAANFPAGYNLFEFSNEVDSTYNNDLTIKDSTGKHLAYLPPNSATPVHLKGAADGWLFPGASPVGKPLRFSATASARIAGTSGTFVRMVPLDADRLLFIVYGISVHAVVYEISTNTWGALTLVRATLGGVGALDNLMAIRIGTDQVLVASILENSGTASVFTLNMSAFTITPGAANSTGLGATAVRLVDLIAVGSSYVLAYVTSVGVLRLRAHTVVSGNVSTGAEALGGTGTAAPAVLPGPGTTIVGLSSTASTLTATPLTVTGTALAVGTAVTRTVTQATNILARLSSAGRWLITYVNTNLRLTALAFSGSTVAFSATDVDISTQFASGSTINSLQIQQYNANVQIASAWSDSSGGFLTEFTAFADSGTGTPTRVGAIVRRDSPAAQIVASVGTDWNGVTTTVQAEWMVSSAKSIELHTFVDTGTTFSAAAKPYRIGPLGYSVATPALPVYPKQALNKSVLSKFSSRSFCVLGDGSKPALYSQVGNDLSTMRATPQLITDPANGARGADDGSVWLAYSYGPDAALTLEQVRIA